MRIIDLSHVMRNGMPQYPGQPDISVKQVARVESDGFQLTDLHADVHVGTHCDAPAHFIAGGKTMDHVPIERFVGDAVIVDAFPQDGREMLPSVLKGKDIRPGDIVLFRSRMADKWGDPDYLREFPYIGEALANDLVARRVKAVGLDFLSPDPVETETFPAHHILLANELGIVENLRNLDLIDVPRVFFSAAPIVVENGDGGFARAFVVIF